MEYKEFLEYVRNGIQKIMGEETHVKIVQVNKNNGIILDGLIIHAAKSNISPTIYLNIFYEQYQKGRKKVDIVNEIYQIYCRFSYEENVDVDMLLDYAKVKSGIVYRLVNFQKNKELLRDVPYVRYLDLAIIFYCMMPFQEERLQNASFLIKEEHLLMWNADIGDIYREAIYHTPELFPETVMGMEDMILKLLCEQTVETEEYLNMKSEMVTAKESGNQMYVLTNQAQSFGAAAILYQKVLYDFSEKLGGNFYILPSSVHEVLIVPDTGDMDAGWLREMVRDVNRKELAMEEILSDNVYYYRRDQDEVEIAKEG